MCPCVQPWERTGTSIDLGRICGYRLGSEDHKPEEKRIPVPQARMYHRSQRSHAFVNGVRNHCGNGVLPSTSYTQRSGKTTAQRTRSTDEGGNHESRTEASPASNHQHPALAHTAPATRHPKRMTARNPKSRTGVSTTTRKTQP